MSLCADGVGGGTYEGLAAAAAAAAGEELAEGATFAFAGEGEGEEAAWAAEDAAGEAAADDDAAADEPELEPDEEDTVAGVPPTVASWKRLGWAPSGKS